jgi:hypothetical protein
MFTKSKSVLVVLIIVGALLIANVIVVAYIHDNPARVDSPNREHYLLVKESDSRFIINEYKSQNRELNRSTEYRGKFGHVAWSNDSSKYAVSMDGVFSDVILADVETGYTVDYDTIVGKVIIEQIEKQLSQVIENPKRFEQHYEFVTWSKNDTLICVYFEMSEQKELRFRGYLWLDLQSNEIVDLLILGD